MAVLKYKNGEGQFVTLTNYTVQPITPVQTTGDSLTDIMSQKAVSDEVNKKVNEAELDGKIADAISGNPTVKNAIADVIGDNAEISGAVEDIAEGAADAKIAAYDAVAEGKFAAKDHNHDDVYSKLGHTHNVADINNFSDEVADAVKTEITNNNSAITESIENIVEKYIYGDDVPSASAEVVTTDNLETTLADYAKTSDIPTVVSAFENDAAYVTSGDVANQININSGTVENIIKKYIYDGVEPSDDAEIVTTDNMDNVLSGYTKDSSLAAVAKSGDYEDLINKPTIPTTVAELTDASDYAKVDDVNDLVASAISESDVVKDAIASAITSDSGITEAIEDAVEGQVNAATSGKMDTDAFEAYSGDVETALNAKFDGARYDSDSKEIQFKSGDNVLVTIDATDFIKDGMVDSVAISGENLVITFNTDSGKDAINIPLTDIFDPSNYYTKSDADSTFLTIASAETIYVKDADIDNKVKEAISSDSGVSASVVTTIENYINGDDSNIYTKQEIEDNFQEKGDYVSAATFNDYTGTTVPSLLDEKADVEHTHYASAVTDFASAVSGLVANNADVKNEIIKEVTESQTFTTLSGDVYTISGDVVALSGEVSGKQDALVSGDNIKTVNGESLLGSGNVDIIDQTLDSGSTKAIANSAITIALIENEEVVSSALNDLNVRILTHSGNTDIHVTAADKTAWNGKLDASALNDYYTKSETDSAIASAITEASGVTPTIVGEMIESALTEATFESSAITDFASAVSGLVATNNDVKTEIIKEVTESQTFTTLSGDVYTISGSIETISNNVSANTDNISAISGDVIALSGAATAAKAVTDFYVGHNSVSSLANLPNTKRLVIADINGSSNELSVSGNSLTDGYEIHVIVANNDSADITVTLPTSANYVSVGETITIKANSTGEINIISDGTTLYVRGA